MRFISRVGDTRYIAATPRSSRPVSAVLTTIVMTAVASCSSDATTSVSAVSTSATAGASDVDDTRLPVGDQQYADTPTRGAVMACRTQNGTAGAQAAGPWFNGDGTWDPTKKIFV